MGKHKRQKLGSTSSHKKYQSKTPKLAKAVPKAAAKPHIQAQHSKPTIPFSPTDNILLIGEGDLSFSSSLIKHHRCTSVTATVLEASANELIAKYPQAADNIAVIERGRGRVRYAVDVGKLKGKSKEWMVKDHGVMKGVVDRVIFNFPHVGGRSRDVNRQVRANQEMLVSFFHASTPLLSPTPGSSIIVTLFEGQPYTLWNIRDLARHSGLEVQRSFRFRADAYPGYRHARTLGVVRRKGDGGVSEGAWRGEEREARTFVFVRRGEGGGGGGDGRGKRKRKRGESESESESDDDDDESEDGDVSGGGVGMGNDAEAGYYYGEDNDDDESDEGNGNDERERIDDGDSDIEAEDYEDDHARDATM